MSGSGIELYAFWVIPLRAVSRVVLKLRRIREYILTGSLLNSLPPYSWIKTLAVTYNGDRILDLESGAALKLCTGGRPPSLTVRWADSERIPNTWANPQGFLNRHSKSFYRMLSTKINQDPYRVIIASSLSTSLIDESPKAQGTMSEPYVYPRPQSPVLWIRARSL